MCIMQASCRQELPEESRAPLVDAVANIGPTTSSRRRNSSKCAKYFDLHAAFGCYMIIFWKISFYVFRF
ncbi:hypothetical protein TYRP_000460 [Tyrophagus putrescentiae]|nr:hypothetical protein TYRP_000460 [Tyrophagus putrescentiae]